MRGQYLKTIYENRIKKKDNIKLATDVGLYTKSYGGQIHFDIFGIDKKRKILGLSGFAGQQILIDLDNKRFHCGELFIFEGDIITINGGNGEVLVGDAPTKIPSLPETLLQIIKWSKACLLYTSPSPRD